jgi:hypothetical protein
MKIGDLVREREMIRQRAKSATGIIIEVDSFLHAGSWVQIKVMWHDERHPFYYSKKELEVISESR